MKILVYSCLAVYLSFYLFEGPIRYVFNMVGADFLIFMRDIVMIVPLLAVIFTKQLINRKVHIAFIIFALVIIGHGFVSYMNLRNPFVIIYCTKMLMSLLIGAIIAPYIMQPDERVVKVLFVFWLVTLVAVFLDKYYVEYPWTGLETQIGDISVEISRDWMVSGADKRAAGLMRSSINAAIIIPFLALILIFNIESALPRLGIIFFTNLMLYWTTQKASIMAFFVISVILILTYRRPILTLKFAISSALLLMILVPIVLPQFDMPNADGVFSLGSFYMRIEEVWPEAWNWILRHQIPPFGVGLGGIGGAQRFYDIRSFNPADNMFIFLYAYFGIFSFLYMGWLWIACMRVKSRVTPDMAMAMCMILFIFFYGIALTMIEDQMASLFLGAAAAWIAKNNAKHSRYYVNQ